MGFKGISNLPPLIDVTQVVGDENIVYKITPKSLPIGVRLPSVASITSAYTGNTDGKVRWKLIAKNLDKAGTTLGQAMYRAIKPIEDLVKQLGSMFDAVGILPGICKLKKISGAVDVGLPGKSNAALQAEYQKLADEASVACDGGDENACDEMFLLQAKADQYGEKAEAEKAAAKNKVAEAAEGLITKAGIMLMTHFAFQFIEKATNIINKLFKFPSPLAVVKFILSAAKGLISCDDSSDSEGTGGGAGAFTVTYMLAGGKEVEMPVSEEMFKLFNSAPKGGGETGLPDADNVAFGVKDGEVGFFEITPPIDEDEFMLKRHYTDDNPQGFLKPPPPHLIRKNVIEP